MLSSDKHSHPCWVPLPWQVLWLLLGTEGCWVVPASPSTLAALHTGAVLASTLLVACAQPLHRETGPAVNTLRVLLKIQTLPAFIWETSLVQGLKGDVLCLIHSHWVFWENWISYWIFSWICFYLQLLTHSSYRLSSSAMRSKAHRCLSMEKDSPIEEKYRNLTGNHRKKHKPQSRSPVHL